MLEPHDDGLADFITLGPMKAALVDIANTGGQRNKALYGYTAGKGITVTTFTGSITDERVDAIVNTTRSNLDLSAGGVSAAILEAAGPAIEEECKKKTVTILEHGKIVATSAGNLPARMIFHGVVKKWDEDQQGSCLTYMRQMIRQCLEEADKRSFDSIAFPAIGAGGLQIPPDFCANVMHEEVLLFINQHSRSTIENIHFVLNPADDALIKAFTAKYQELVSGKGKTAGAKSEETITKSMLAAAFGNGVYFAVNPAYSTQLKLSPPDGNKVKYIYQCRVLTGSFCKGEPGLKAPPKIPSLPDGVRYDSVVDDVDDPAIFVIFQDSQVYPDYLIQLLDTEGESGCEQSELICKKKKPRRERFAKSGKYARY